VHYQGRLKVKTKDGIRWSQFKEHVFPEWEWVHFSPTCKAASQMDKFYDYVTKLETRTAGPWADKDPVWPATWAIPGQNFSFQTELITWSVEEPDDRIIKPATATVQKSYCGIW
jgi:hypothetical protein